MRWVGLVGYSLRSMLQCRSRCIRWIFQWQRIISGKCLLLWQCFRCLHRSFPFFPSWYVKGADDSAEEESVSGKWGGASVLFLLVCSLSPSSLLLSCEPSSWGTCLTPLLCLRSCGGSEVLYWGVFLFVCWWVLGFCSLLFLLRIFLRINLSVDVFAHLGYVNWSLFI